MNIQRKSKLSGVVFIACFGLMTSAYSGVITGVPQAAPSVADGFGGWNLDNVEVLITDTDYVPSITKFYDHLDGSYDAMVSGDSFESLIYDGDPDTATVMGRLHGKDWPVGEPSGVKVLTDTLAGTGEVMPNGKPDSCIMTTSYHPEGFFLDAILPATPAPTTCSSEFQSHKRFKINLQPSLVDGVGEESVDMVFNVEPHPTNPNDNHRYQVYQKINNYTDWRLSGYTLEVGFGVGANFIPRGDYAALSLSIGIGENPQPDPDTGLYDIWAVEQMANFSHGLWGPAGDPKYFDEDGFFSDIRAGYKVSLSEDRRVITTVDTLDNVLGSNYEIILGEWLPDRWQPSAVFWDDDGDPETDAAIMAYWADYDGDGTYAWTGGFADNFEQIDQSVVNSWATNPIYFVDGIEDVLNLGLNYIVEVGSILSFPTWNEVTETATFTIRITPIKAALNQVEPDWVSNPPVLEYSGINPAIIMYVLN